MQITSFSYAKLKLESGPDLMPLAVVLGLSPTGLFVVRSLGRKNVRVIGIDKDAWCVGRFSKYLSSFFRVSNSEMLYRLMINIASKEDKKPIIFCAADEYLYFLAEYYKDLRDYYVMPECYTRDTINLFLNKLEFYKMCIKNSVDLPKTYFPSSIEEVISISKEINYPCIIKPTFSHLWRKKLKGKKMIEVNSPKELIFQYRTLSPAPGELIIQEVIPGGDELIYVFGGYFNENSEPLAVFTGRKLRQFPPRFGSASLLESYENHKVLEKSISLLKRLNFHGICGTEFKWDPRSGSYKMMEINIRPTLWFSVTSASGADIIYTAYRDLAGFPSEVYLRQENYGKWVYFVRDMISSIYYITQGQLSLKNWIKSLKGINAHAIYAEDDIFPAVLQPISIFKEFIDYFLKGGQVA